MVKIKSMRDLLAAMPANGNVRHSLRNFNFGMGNTGRIPSVLELVKSLGFDVLLVKLPKSTRGRLVNDIFADNGYRIEVNQDDDVQTRRWTVLHEMMHAFLHRKDDPFAADQYRAGGSHFYNSDELQEEQEANAYVEALIFGENALSAAKSLFGDDNKAMAKKFGVSEKTLSIALRKL